LKTTEVVPDYDTVVKFAITKEEFGASDSELQDIDTEMT